MTPTGLSKAVAALKTGSKHHAVHALRKEITGPNAAARVAAARGLLEGGGDGEGIHRPQQQAPGVTIVIMPSELPRPGVVIEHTPAIE